MSLSLLLFLEQLHICMQVIKIAAYQAPDQFPGASIKGQAHQLMSMQ